jgi:hypothetical protein
MQRAPLFFLTLTLATHCSEAVTIVAPSAAKPPVLVSSAQTSASHADIAVQASADEKSAAALSLDPLFVRPHAGKGVENVTYALRAMNFYGADLKAHTFKIDMVMSLKWTDPRVIEQIPDGLDQLSMSWTQAKDLIWMPGIVVSNRDIEKYEIISASVTLFRSGLVNRVERANTRVMMKYMLEEYPFDSQHLALNIASSKYMMDELVLLPDQKDAGVEENIWGLYDMQSWHTKSFVSHDGDLQKSRGSLVVEVKRGLDKYSQDHLWPSFIVLMISWAVFYFPFANQFIMARLALSILALLTFTNLVVKSCKELPGAAPFNWNDLFNQQIQTLMFLTIVLNVCTEIAFHQFHHEHLARGMNHEAKVLVPILSIVNVVVIVVGGQKHWITLVHAGYITKVFVFLFALCYIGYVVTNEYCMTAKEREEDEKAHDAGVLADSLSPNAFTAMFGAQAVVETVAVDADAGC